MYKRYRLPFLTAMLVLIFIFSIKISNAAQIKKGLSHYGPITAAQTNWMLANFDLIGTDRPAISAEAIVNKIWSYYKEIYMISGQEYLEFKDWAYSNGVNPYEAILRPKINYLLNLTVTSNPAWSNYEKFDGFENAKGVMRTSDEISYTDLTATVFNGNVTLSNTVYFGYEEAFAEVNFTFATLGIGVSSFWEYWNGSEWGSLVVIDGTNAYSNNGKISFIPPSDWSRKIINASRNKYFVRVRFVGATTNPISSSIKGESWLVSPSQWVSESSIGQYVFVKPTISNGFVYYNVTGGVSGSIEPAWPTTVNATVIDGTITWKTGVAGRALRGWDSSSGTIINVGSELEYNPTPSLNASAKFPYQAAVTAWSNNNFVLNPADKQTINGTYEGTWSRFWAKSIVDKVNSSFYTACLGDDLDGDPTNAGITPSNTNFADKSINSWTTEMANQYSYAVTLVRNARNDIRVGANTQFRHFAKLGYWNNVEYMNYIGQTGGSSGNTRKLLVSDAPLYMTYDDYLPVNNPLGTVGLMKYADVYLTTIQNTYNPVGAAWDRGNRGPIMTLAKHLIGANENTYFAYYTTGGFIYNESDEVVLNDNSIIHLATDSVPDPATVKRWSNYFPAMSVDFGEPDIAGYNAGLRNIQWIRGGALGGTDGVSDVWRRDYTNAIVLHRPGAYNTTTAEYDIPSPPISLGSVYYPLRADGKTTEGVTEITLRAAEGAILMKAPLGADMIAPSAPSGLSVQ